ncbi:MAG: hypothetical protein PHO90_00940 [Candidatus Pacebacteria bacterium]|jgi:hypothetical protein|nr:hypothetical protein [Candidatus Paceibacterota bacterium]
MLEKIIDVLKKDDKPPKPFFEKPRFPCPFYGFHFSFGELFWGGDGNYCGLVGRVCLMEHCPSGPDWRECPCNNKENEWMLAHAFLGTTIAPHEFRPPGKKPWRGMPMVQWAWYVMDSGTPRPEKTKMSETPTETVEND